MAEAGMAIVKMEKSSWIQVYFGKYVAVLDIRPERGLLDFGLSNQMDYLRAEQEEPGEGLKGYAPQPFKPSRTRYIGPMPPSNVSHLISYPYF